jgi:IS4 transposase
VLTNREANDVDAVVELSDWYRARWEIEMFFHVLKNGCKVDRSNSRKSTAWSGRWRCTWSWHGALPG